MKRLLFTIALLAFASQGLAQPSTGYATATPDTPSNDGEAGFSFVVDLSDMPASWWSTAENTDATRGRVYRNDGTTELAVDWIAYDDSGETGFIRFKDDMAASPTTYRIYPPVSGNATVAASATYGSDNAYASHIVGYWENGGNNDRTSNGNDGTTTGATAGGATGKIATATDYANDAGNLATEYTATGLSPGSTHKAMLGWIRADNLPAASKFSNFGANDGSNHRFYLGFSENKFVAGYGTAFSTDTDVLSAATWYHMALVESGGTVKGYVNGVEELSFAATFSGTSSAPLTIGARATTASAWNSPLDGQQGEIMASTSSLAQEWVVEEYRQTNDNTAYWSDDASSGWTWNAASSGDPNPLTPTLPGGTPDPLKRILP